MHGTLYKAPSGAFIHAALMVFAFASSIAPRIRRHNGSLLLSAQQPQSFQT